MPRMDDFPEKKIKKNVEDRPINNDFFENCKTAKMKEPEENRRNNNGPNSAARRFVTIKLRLCCRNAVKTNTKQGRPVSRELNNNIY